MLSHQPAHPGVAARAALKKSGYKTMTEATVTRYLELLGRHQPEALPVAMRPTPPAPPENVVPFKKTE